MTEVTIQEDRGKHVFEIKGHAGYGERGTDIVCAAISTLGYTLLNELMLLEKRGTVTNVEHEEAEGYLCITFYEKNKDVKMVLETIETGFYMLQENFFEFLRVRGEK